MNIGIVDIETTGFLDTGGKIVEVGIASLDLKTGDVSKAYSEVCREPNLSFDDTCAWIFDNSDLKPCDVARSDFLTTLMPDIQSCINSFEAVTAFNKRFDFDFLRDRGLKIEREWPCPMLVATNVCKLPGRRGDYKWPKVEEAWAHLFPEEPYVEKHRGFDDAAHEAMIVHELHKRGLMIKE